VSSSVFLMYTFRNCQGELWDTSKETAKQRKQI